jgi:methionyl-tRNA formyltransferase
MSEVDLLVGGTLGAWAVAAVAAADIAHVVTSDVELARLAAQRGFDVVGSFDGAGAPRALSVHYQRIIAHDVLDGYEAVYNLHPGYLPWGRGFYPVFWALWEGTPAGATLHHVVAELDAGPIVDQVEVEVRADDTGGSLHERVQAAERQLFARWWPQIAAGEPLPSRPQGAPRSEHTRAEFFALKRTGWRSLAAEEVERLERCLEFPGYTGLEGRDG